MTTINETSDKGNRVSLFINKENVDEESDEMLEILSYLGELLSLADDLVGEEGLDPNYG